MLTMFLHTCSVRLRPLCSCFSYYGIVLCIFVPVDARNNCKLNKPTRTTYHIKKYSLEQSTKDSQ